MGKGWAEVGRDAQQSAVLQGLVSLLSLDPFFHASQLNRHHISNICSPSSMISQFLNFFFLKSPHTFFHCCWFHINAEEKRQQYLPCIDLWDGTVHTIILRIIINLYQLRFFLHLYILETAFPACWNYRHVSSFGKMKVLLVGWFWKGITQLARESADRHMCPCNNRTHGFVPWPYNLGDMVWESHFPSLNQFSMFLNCRVGLTTISLFYSKRCF